MRLWPALVLAGGLIAQELAPIGIVRGTLAGCDSTSLTVRAPGDHVYRFVVDEKTFIEREHFRISCSEIDNSDQLEIVSDRSDEPRARYARLVKVAGADVAARRKAWMAARAPVPYEDPTLAFAPRGALTITGVVLRVDHDGMALRTRGSGEKWILMRDDTRYREDGLAVEASKLRSGARVFVRAGPNLDGEIEAYEVVWGEILAPPGKR